jgi:hypothetical protein
MKNILNSCAVLALVATPAYAQIEGSVEGSASVDASVGGGAINDGTDGTMAASGASATGNSIGIGVLTTLGGALTGFPGAISVDYDAGQFNAGGFVAVVDDDGDDNFGFLVGGRFFYHVAKSSYGDFGVGGSLAIVNQATGPDDSATALFIDPGFQIRAFVASNVALVFAGGITIGAADAGGIALGGQLSGSAGVHYYFSK